MQAELAREVVRQDRQGGEMVERRVEIALDLTGVQVDADDTIGAGGREKVGDELRADRLARERLVVLARVSVIPARRP